MPKINDGAFIINFDEYKSIVTRWVALHMNCDNVTYFERLGAEYIAKEIKKFGGNKNITINTYRIDANDTIMFGYFCIGLIDFILESNFI